MFFKVPKEEAMYENAFVTRKHLALPVSISTLMNLFEATIQEKKHAFKIFNNTNCDILNINPHLHQAFSNKTKVQKISYYSQCVQYLSGALAIGDYQEIKKQHLHPIVEAKAFIKSKILGKWEKYEMKISVPNGRVVFIGNKTQIVITMDKYYVRCAKDSSKQSIVVDSIMDNSSYTQLRVAFEQHFHVQLKKILEDLSWQAEKNRFRKILKQSSGEIRSFIQQKTKLAPSGFLTQKVIDNFLDFKKKVEFTISEQKFNKRFILNQGSRRLYIVKDIYYYEQFFFLSKDQLMKALKFPTDHWNSLVKQYSLIQTQQQHNLQVIYQKFRLKDKLYETIYVRQDISTETEGKLILQAVKNHIRTNRNTQILGFDYSFIRVIPISQTQCKFLIETDVQFNSKQEHELICLLIGQYTKLYQSFLNQPKMAKVPDFHYDVSQLDIKSSASSNVRNPLQQVVLFPQQAYLENKVQTNITNGKLKQDEINGSLPILPSIISDNSYLKHRFSVQPDQRSERVLDLIHYLWQDWQKAESGGIICINQKIINEQKKIFKHIIASFGKNIFKIKSVLNISLPVGIFKRQSHLNTIAKNFSYAPIFFDRKSEQNQLERMKLATTFLITIGTVGISMQKPFNPVIGETFQGWIDGCPIYLQQVSHHPPRSAYIMYGRGYKIYGQIEPKIELGMNCIKGYNERQNIIEFDDGTKLSFSIPKLVIKGMLYGDREFNFEDKNYIYDITHHLFSQITFGPKRSGGFWTKAEDPTDFVFGRIMKVNPNFYIGWKDKRKTYPQKGDILQQITSFEGVWTQNISFDNKLYFDFKNELPCRLDHQQYSLLSNSTHRKDLQKLIQNKIEEAQAQKQIMQEFQRRDRRLRQGKSKK